MDKNAWLLGLLAGCAHAGSAEAWVDAQQRAEADLARLRALEVFEVGGLVLDEPGVSANCYGVPCPGETVPAAAVAEIERQADRLHDLVGRAEAAIGTVPSCEGDPDADLGDLRDLAIVEVGALIEAQPAPDANCYGLPCPDEVERVEAENCRRQADLAAIARASRGL